MTSNLQKLRTEDEIYAWHFSTGELRFDYAGTKVKAGLILETDDNPIPDKVGFHASVKPLDALRFFAIRPNDRKMISRVKLRGQIVEDGVSQRGTRLTAQRREHLWVADAQDSLESFALSFLDLVFDWLKKDNILISDIIFEALNERKRYLEGNSSRQQVHLATEELIQYAKEQSNPIEYIPDINDPNGIITWYTKRLRYTADTWQEFWKDQVYYLPAYLAKTLGTSLRRDTQYLVFNCIGIAYNCQYKFCNYHGWYRAIAEDSPLITKHIDDYIEQVGNTWIGNYVSLLLRDGLNAPEPYLKNSKFRFPVPENELHQRLMQLAPDDYQEPV